MNVLHNCKWRLDGTSSFVRYIYYNVMSSKSIIRMGLLISRSSVFVWVPEACLSTVFDIFVERRTLNEGKLGSENCSRSRFRILMGGGGGLQKIMCMHIHHWFILIFPFEDCISSVESQKGAITIQRCSVENQKGAIAIDIVTVIAPFWFSTEHLLILIAPFWLITDNMCIINTPWSMVIWNIWY